MSSNYWNQQQNNDRSAEHNRAHGTSNLVQEPRLQPQPVPLQSPPNRPTSLPHANATDFISSAASMALGAKLAFSATATLSSAISFAICQHCRHDETRLRKDRGNTSAGRSGTACALPAHCTPTS